MATQSTRTAQEKVSDKVVQADLDAWFESAVKPSRDLKNLLTETTHEVSGEDLGESTKEILKAIDGWVKDWGRELTTMKDSAADLRDEVRQMVLDAARSTARSEPVLATSSPTMVAASLRTIAFRLASGEAGYAARFAKDVRLVLSGMQTGAINETPEHAVERILKNEDMDIHWMNQIVSQFQTCAEGDDPENISKYYPTWGPAEWQKAAELLEDGIVDLEARAKTSEFKKYEEGDQVEVKRTDRPGMSGMWTLADVVNAQYSPGGEMMSVTVSWKEGPMKKVKVKKIFEEEDIRRPL